MPPTIVPLGDQTALIYFADEQAALQGAAQLRRAALPWLVDLVQAYTSIGVYFDLGRIRYAEVVPELGRHLIAGEAHPTETAVRRHLIPCCYDFPLDLPRVAKHTGLSADEIIRLHTETEYTVYAIGFCPGFPYLGYLPEPLCGVPRLPSPRLRVAEGSVGLTGRQTGIYTQQRPGGWNLLGQTPLQLVNVADEYFPLRTGDRVQFQRIDESEYRRLQGTRL